MKDVYEEEIGLDVIEKLPEMFFANYFHKPDNKIENKEAVTANYPQQVFSLEIPVKQS